MPGFSPGLAQALAQQPQQEPDLERWRRLAEQMAGPAEMRSYDPSLRERMGNWVYDTLSGLGMPSQAEHTRGVVTGGADFVPGLGNAVTGEEAGRAFGEGNYGEGALLGAAALVPIPAAGKAVAKGTKKLAKVLAGETVKEGAAELGMGIRAYHGSPHSFERFSTEKIGTGEGAQAYGHGLYFAGNEGVAKDYRQKLSRSLYETSEGTLQHGDVYDKLLSAADQVKVDDLGRALHPDHRRGVVSQLLEGVDEFGSMDRYAKEYGYPEGFQKLHEAVAAKAKELDVRPAKGSMYEVDIAAEPEQFLDWDKPLREHPPHIQQAALGTTAPPDPQALRQRAEAASGATKEFMLAQADYLEGKLQSTGEGWHGGGPKPEISERLHEAGIPGIKFLDQGSRGPATIYNVGSPAKDFGPYSPFTSKADAEAHQDMLKRQGFADAEIKEQAQPQTSNYVVFDDKLISILRKYGMGGMVGTAAGYEMAQQLMQQEDAQQPQPTGSRLAPLLMQQLPQTAPWSPNAT